MTFDEWLDSTIPRNDHAWREALDEDQINAAHAAWNACNRAAREECAAICDRFAKAFENDQRSGGAVDCADEIRETIK
jgi:hypothetical protein